jgi:CBS domain-containing protein
MKPVSELVKTGPKQVISVQAGDSVLDAIRVLAENDVGAVTVMEGERLVGMFSERDYTRKIVLQGRSSRDTLVSEIMSSPVISVGPMTRTRECMRLMTERNFRHLPVVEGGRVIGMVSIRDIIGDICAEQAFEIEQLEQYIHRS